MSLYGSHDTAKMVVRSLVPKQYIPLANSLLLDDIVTSTGFFSSYKRLFMTTRITHQTRGAQTLTAREYKKPDIGKCSVLTSSRSTRSSSQKNHHMCQTTILPVRGIFLFFVVPSPPPYYYYFQGFYISQIFRTLKCLKNMSEKKNAILRLYNCSCHKFITTAIKILWKNFKKLNFI